MKIIENLKYKAMSKPYKSHDSNIGFKAIGKSSDFRTLPLTDGKIYIPIAYTVSYKGYYTDFLIPVEGGKTIRVVKSDIGSLFKVVPYVREKPVNEDETL